MSLRQNIRLLPGLLSAALLLAACAQAPVSPSVTPSPGLLADSTGAPDALELPVQDSTESPPPHSTPTATLIAYDTPEWFRDDVVYEIFVRSFADSDGNGIGDLNGITGRLDYLQALGVDTVWLMPVYASPSVHGYDVSDYFQVNPDYGYLEDLQALVEAAHSRKMSVILDFVPSHLSNQNPLFQEAYKNLSSEKSDWFVWTNDAHTTYTGFAGNQEMPRFNHYNPEVVAYLAEAAKYWLDLDGDGDMTDGVDGFRVDNVTFPPQEFLVALRQAVKQANPDALLLGEAWVHSPADISRFYPDQFDALFDFPLYELMQGNQDSNADGLLAGKGFPVLLTALLEDQVKRYPEGALALRFFSNHDTNRIATEVSGDVSRQRLAAALLTSLPGPILVYYGEEIGMPGQKGGEPYWDNYRREPMDWYDDEQGKDQAAWFKPEDRWNKPGDGISVEEQDSDPDSLLNFYRHVISIRRSSKALSAGAYSVLEVDAAAPGAWGLLRSAGDESVAALYNFSGEALDVTVKSFPFAADSLRDLIHGETYPGAELGQPTTLNLPPGSAMWLVGH